MNKTDQAYESGDRPAIQEGRKSGAFQFGSFGLDSEDCFANILRKLNQEWSGFLVREGRSLAEAYLHGDVDIHLHLSAGAKNYGKLVISRVPFVDKMNVAGVDIQDGTFAETEASRSADRRRERLMDFAVPQFIQFPEKVFPAFVRFEVKEVGANGFWDLGEPSRQVFNRVVARLPAREFGVFWLGLSAKFNGSVEDCVIQSGTQAVHNFEGDDSKFWGHWLERAHLYDRLSGARIKILGPEVRFAANIRFLSGIKFIDMMACPRD